MTQNDEKGPSVAGPSQEVHVAAGCGTDVIVAEPGGPDPDVITELWAGAKAARLARDFPKYGSRLWIALPPDDPRRLAAALEAAELWRKYGDEEELLAWFIEVNRSRPPLTTASAPYHPGPAHQLRATPGWPPIAIPGQPGKYLRYNEQKAAA